MSADRAALVAAIGADPDDDTPRLACADWFEEQGGEANAARAAFIRAQVGRARLPQSDPRQSELEARELRLLREHFSTWAGSHFAFKKCKFRRGFIEYVHLHLKHFLHHRRQLLALEPVQEVSLTGWLRSPPHLYDRVAGCAEWDRIRTLWLLPQGEHHAPDAGALRVLESPRLGRLRGLHLSCVAFDANARRRFERLPVMSDVEALTLPALDSFRPDGGDWFEDGGPAAGGWANVRALSLPHYCSTDALGRLASLPFWGRLRGLSVGLIQDSAATLDLLLRRMPNDIQALRLVDSGSGTAALPGAVSMFARLSDTPLDRLALQHARADAATLRPLFADGGRCLVRDVSFRGFFSLDHAKLLAESPKADRLERLTVSADGITDAAAAALFAPGRFRALSHLSLYARQLTDAGLAALAASDLPALRSLEIIAAEVSEGAVAALLDSPVCRNLVRLTFTATASQAARPFVVTAALARRLAELPHLAAVSIGAPKIEPEARDVIRDSDALGWRCVRDYGRTFDPWDGSPPVDNANEFAA